MKMKSHVLLAQYLLSSIPNCHSVIYQKAFVFGCIEPDLNIFSYLKGSVTCQKLRGHNYDNSYVYTLRTFKKLQGREKWGLRDYYRFGKLIHYLADAFTYPHNESFTGTLWEHRIYETHLHPHFSAYLRQCKKNSETENLKDISAFIAGLHGQYARLPGADMRFVSLLYHRLSAPLSRMG